MKTFTNDIGQEITPGEQVLVVTETYKQIHTRLGKFVGWSEAGNIQVEVLPRFARGEWFDKRTSQAGSYYTIPQEFRDYRTKEKVPTIVTLQRNRIYRVA